MTPFKAILPGVMLVLFSCSTNDHFVTSREINKQCTLEKQAALTAIRLRNRGKSRQELAGTLPALDKDSSRLLVYLHEIVQESYQYPALNEITYPAYRFELCARQLAGKPYPVNVAHIYPALLSCQHEFGDSVSPAAEACISTCFTNYQKQKR